MASPILSLPRAEPPPLAPPEVLAFVERVEALGPDEAGAFLFGRPEDPSGVVYVEARRVCLAMDSSSPGRLRQLLHPEVLRERSPQMQALLQKVHSRADIMQLYRAGHPALRPILLEHTSEAILGLLDREAPPVWASRGRRYAARLSFDSAELLAGLCRAHDGTEPLGPLLEGAVEHPASAVALCEDPPTLCDARDDLGLGARAVLELASWARARLETADLACPGVTLMLEGDRAAWRRGELTFAARTQDQVVVSRILAPHVRSRAASSGALKGDTDR